MSPLLLLALAFVAPVRAESFQAWVARAHRAERRKDDGAALQYYSNALSSWTSNDGALSKAKAFCARAALRERGANADAGAALKDYSDCLALDRRNAKALDRRGRLLLDAGKAREALDDFYAAVKFAPGFAQAYDDRARSLEATGDQAFAREDYRHACRLGLKTSCAKASGAAPRAKDAAAAKTPEPPPVWVPAPARPKPRPAAAPKKKIVSPHFSDCLSGLQACTDDGASFGECVDKAPVCGRKAAPSCCPRACVKTFRKTVDNGASEAAAFRSIFTPDAPCAKTGGG